MKDIEQRKAELREISKAEKPQSFGDELCPDMAFDKGREIGKIEMAREALEIIDELEKNLKQESGQRDFYREKYLKSCSGER